MTTIPRSVVAAALAVSEDSLPPGDLPLDRFAERHAGWLATPDEQREAHADLWTFDLMVALVKDHPDLAFAAVQATLDRCTTPDQVANLAAGPMEDLIRFHGAALIDVITTAAAEPRFRYLLSGVWQGDTPALLWARIEAARRGGPALDDGDPLPPR